MLQIGRMRRARLSAAEQPSLSHDPPDPLVVDLPSGTKQSFGHTTVAIASENFANLLNGEPSPLIVYLVS